MTGLGLRRISLDIGLTFGRQFLAGLLQLGIILMISRFLGPEGVGIYAVALLVPTILSQLMNFGLASANVYFFASGQFSLEEVWASSRDLVVATGVIGLALGMAVITLGGAAAFPGVPQAVLLLALLVFPFSLLATVIASLFQALQDFRAYNVIVLVQPAAALMLMGLLWAFGAFTLIGVLAATIAAHAIAMSIALAVLSRWTALSAPTQARWVYLRPALSYGIKAHLGNLLTFLNYRLDLFLVNLFAGPAAAGLYAVAVRLAEQLWMVSQAFSTVIFPRLSALAGDEGARRALTPILARTALWVTLAGAGVLAAIAQPLIILLFGTEFAGAAPALLILLPGIVLLACARVLANDLASRGMVGINLALAAGVLAVNTIANLLLIPPFGIIGAAAATSLAYTLVLLVRLVLQYKITEARWWTLLILQPEDLRRLKGAMRGTMAS